MTGLDIAVLLLVGLNAATGFTRGFIHEILSLCAWALAIFAIHQLHTPLTHWLAVNMATPSGAAVLAFAVLLLVPYAAVKLIATWLRNRSKNSLLAPVDRLLGLGFGAVRGMIIVVLGFSVLVLGYDTVWGPKGRPDWMTQARSYRFVDASSRAMVRLIAERRARLLSSDAQAD